MKNISFPHLSNPKDALELATDAAAVLSCAALALTVCSGYYVIKMIRCMNAAQRALPVMEKAAKLYIQEHTAQDAETKGMKKRVFVRRESVR